MIFSMALTLCVDSHDVLHLFNRGKYTLASYRVLPRLMAWFQFAFMSPVTGSEAANSALAAEGDITDLLRRAGIHVPAASNDAIGSVFRIGGVSALVAAWLCWQMRRRRKAVLDSM